MSRSNIIFKILKSTFSLYFTKQQNLLNINIQIFSCIIRKLELMDTAISGPTKFTLHENYFTKTPIIIPFSK